jgi:hypothetical protein
MSDTTKDLKAELDKSVGLLKTLRDEMRVKLHLAGMDTKDQWNKLQPHLDHVMDAAKDVSAASHTAVTEALASVKKLKDSIG